MTKSTNRNLSLPTEAQEETTPKGIVQYIGRFGRLHKKGSRGLSAKGSNGVRNDVGRSEEKVGAVKRGERGLQMTA